MSETSGGIERYLAALRQSLAGTDPATVQDAIADADEHLRSALAQALAREPGLTEGQALPGILAQFGTPDEVARAYREMEPHLAPPFARRAGTAPEPKSPLARWVSVLGDPRAYGALFYMLFSMIAGVITFTWAVVGISLSLGLMVLIFGLPFFGLFVFSIQGMGLVEGRVIEALLGVRMPRRLASPPAGTGLWGKFKARLKDRRTWTTLLYMILKLPLGVIYFSVFVVLLAYSLQLMVYPALSLIFDLPFIVINNLRFAVPWPLLPVLVLAGFLDLIVILHLARLTGRMHAGLAKGFLVKA